MSSPDSESVEEDENLNVIPINRAFSDGNSDFWPTDPKYREVDDTVYRQKLAARWMMEMGAYVNDSGVDYILDALPEGYVMFDRPRGTNPDIRDRFLYGHPCGQYFDSTIKFFPHFYYLMTEGKEPCKCVNCGKLKSRTAEGGKPRGRPVGSGRASGLPFRLSDSPAGSSVGSPAPGSRRRERGRPPYGLSRPPGRIGRPPKHPIVDGEGTPDVYKMAVKELFHRGTLDRKIAETDSMDWRAEKEQLEEHLERVALQQSYVPRLGEIVLWAPSLEDELRLNPDTERIEVYPHNEGEFVGAPEWRAGIVSQVPKEDVSLYDIVETSEKEEGVTYSGFRIETFPDPLSADKSYSLHYKYVPLKCIKPFNAFEIFLQRVPRAELHPSVEYAMTVMSSFSLLNKHRISGNWPNASIYCQGIYLGAELLVVGDAVRLKPRGCTVDNALRTSVTDVLVIEEIRLDLRSCIEDTYSDQIAESYGIRIRGKVYTNSPLRASTLDRTHSPQKMSHDQIIAAFHYTGMNGYGDWYSLHSGAPVEVSQDMITSRCYEPDAMKILFGSLSISRDLHGVLMGRNYSRQTDQRIAEGKDWFWGDYRTQTLAVETLNGEDVGKYSEARDVKMWRANLRVIDGSVSPADLKAARLPGELGRPSTKSRLSFGNVRKTSTLVSTGLGVTDISNNVSSESRPGSESSETDEDSMEDQVEDTDMSEREGKRPRLG